MINKDLPEVTEEKFVQYKEHFESFKEIKKQRIMKIINSEKMENLPSFIDCNRFEAEKPKSNLYDKLDHKIKLVIQARSNNPFGQTNLNKLPNNMSTSATSQSLKKTENGYLPNGVKSIINRIEHLNTKGLVNIDQLVPSIRNAHEKNVVIEHHKKMVNTLANLDVQNKNHGRYSFDTTNTPLRKETAISNISPSNSPKNRGRQNSSSSMPKLANKSQSIHHMTSIDRYNNQQLSHYNPNLTKKDFQSNTKIMSRIDDEVWMKSIGGIFPEWLLERTDFKDS